MVWYLKEPYQWDGSFEHPKHTLDIMGKTIFTILWRKALCFMCGIAVYITIIGGILLDI